MSSQQERNRKLVIEKLEALVAEAGCTRNEDGSWNCTVEQERWLEPYTSETACARLSILMNATIDISTLRS